MFVPARGGSSRSLSPVEIRFALSKIKGKPPKLVTAGILPCNIIESKNWSDLGLDDTSFFRSYIAVSRTHERGTSFIAFGGRLLRSTLTPTVVPCTRRTSPRRRLYPVNSVLEHLLRHIFSNILSMLI